MVSYPESSLALRRPPSSVASSSHSRATSTTRRHRHHRSHAGGESRAPQNEFPVFIHTGDVEIVITNSPHHRGGRRQETYVLHRLILAQCSGFFEAGTSEEWARAQAEGRTQQVGGAALARVPSNAAPVDESGRRKRWRYELDWGQSPDDIPMLAQKCQETSQTQFNAYPERAPQPPRPANKPTSHTGFFRSLSNFSSLAIPSTPSHPSHSHSDPDDDIFRDYSNLFRIFYNYSPSLDSVNIAQAYVECKTLLQLADMYDALDVIGPRIDHHLLRFQGRLFKQIAKYPPSYLKLGYLARSRVIYSEALIHVVGQWPQGASQLRNGQISPIVLEVVEDKADELEELKSKIEGKLFRLTLTTSRGERVTPSNNWLDWLAMSLFRQWFAENTTPPPVSILKERTAGLIGGSNSRAPSSRGSISRSDLGQTAPPPQFGAQLNTGRIFRLIGAGGSAYLPHDELKRFLKLHSDLYTRENMRRFERRVDELKNLARDVVKPLMRNFLELDLGRDGGAELPYLTCTKVTEADFVWEE
ncbi:hypothetical protein K490DRAFT_32618 [Saccharata proteae CBS 121410]|uniref:BTB domain-containing protein n=1 Tax=Saccharata proteae CBS 121410 TaxID=1314787 RepID=A0A9P4I4V4_9PEZI|nr:hypothetical protein K490DRAFT_32618 [Saccharata proteae CBS 121410]